VRDRAHARRSHLVGSAIDDEHEHGENMENKAQQPRAPRRKPGVEA
jgi:hypothetical protein